MGEGHRRNHLMVVVVAKHSSGLNTWKGERSARLAHSDVLRVPMVHYHLHIAHFVVLRGRKQRHVSIITVRGITQSHECLRRAELPERHHREVPSRHLMSMARDRQGHPPQIGTLSCPQRTSRHCSCLTSVRRRKTCCGGSRQGGGQGGAGEEQGQVR